MEDDGKKDVVTALVIGDVHYKTKNAKETHTMECAIAQLLQERTPDFIVVLGDILDTHERIHESPLSRAIFFLKMLQNYAPLYIIVGNHDRINNSVFLTDEHPFNALKYWNNTTVVDVVKQDIIQGHLFTFVPYVYPGRFMEAIDTLYGMVKNPPPPPRETMLPSFLLAASKVVEEGGGFTGNLLALMAESETYISTTTEEESSFPDRSFGPWKSSTCLFAHQEFKGAKMGAIVSEDGDAWSLDLPLVVSGHIHNYDRLQPNLYFIGTPIQHSFGDRADKTVSWFCFGPDSKEFTEERIDLHLPRKIILQVPYEDIERTEIPPDTEVKVILIGNTSQIKTAAKLSKIKKWVQEGVKVVYRDVSEIHLEKQNPIVTVPYPELMVQTIQKIGGEEGNTLLALFREISVEI